MLFRNSAKKMGALVMSFFILIMSVSQVHAGMIGTDALMLQQQQQIDRAQLNSMLDRADVQSKLAEMGVDPIAAQERVAALTDEEVTQLSQHFESLPAGEGVVGIIVLFFIIFIITDMLGATDIFPFVKSIR